MENYSYNYPDSGDSSPRSREIEFENPPPWDDQSPHPQNYKARFMCSYGGKIQPRPHDNLLSYVGGETKILAVDRHIKFSAMLAKLSSICETEVTFKYQLPGEDLDALISVTNDDDLEHMMHEYDRLYRPSAKPARMRLFLFPVNTPPTSFGSDRDGRFMDALNTVPVPTPPEPVKDAPPPGSANKVDFLFGLEKGVNPPPPTAAVKFHDPVPEPVAPPPEFHLRGGGPPDRVLASDPLEIQRQLQDMQRLQIAEHEQSMYRRKSEDNLGGGYSAGDYYVQKLPEKSPSPSIPATAHHHTGLWPDRQVSSGGFPAQTDQPVYVIPTPGTFYHAPVGRPPTGPTTQGYYAMQRMGSDVYREQPMYSAVPPPQTQLSSAPSATLPPPQPAKISPYSEGFGVVRPSGIADNSGGYTQVAYDSAVGRQVYYTAPGGMVHPPAYQGVAPPVTADMRSGASLGQEVKVVNKVSQSSV